MRLWKYILLTTASSNASGFLIPVSLSRGSSANQFQRMSEGHARHFKVMFGNNEGTEDIVRGAQTTFHRVKDVLLNQSSIHKLVFPMAVSGALLGPNLDNFHSAFGVLAYTNPIKINFGDSTLLTTDWWVPPLFAVAGAGIGLLYVVLDEVLGTPASDRAPEWGGVFLTISAFSLQYYLSGLLTSVNSPPWLLWGILLTISWWVYAASDNTRVGLVVSTATALLGPAIEVFLVNVPHLYNYNGSDLWGVDSWIPVVYFCGAPAVGGLARALHTEIVAEEERGD
ncbi:unnamed protein product [Discosporangium mesarthrocarpum]